jgi:hypothetical protein
MVDIRVMAMGHLASAMLPSRIKTQVLPRPMLMLVLALGQSHIHGGQGAYFATGVPAVFQCYQAACKENFAQKRSKEPIAPAPPHRDRSVPHHDRSEFPLLPTRLFFLFNIPKKTYLIKRLFKRSKNI